MIESKVLKEKVIAGIQSMFTFFPVNPLPEPFVVSSKNLMVKLYSGDREQIKEFLKDCEDVKVHIAKDEDTLYEFFTQFFAN